MQKASTSSSPMSRASARSFPDDESSDEEEMDWEEVAVPSAPDTSIPVGPSQPIEITLDAAKKGSRSAKKVSVMSHAERVARLDAHKFHTICLIANGWIRNKYLNDALLHARLMSLTPLALQNAFTQIHKKREPDVARRGRLFEAAIMRLTQWWTEVFFEADQRGNGEIQNRTFDEVEAALRENGGEIEDEAQEVIRSCKSLQKHALLRNGSRDVSAQLFTALCRALGVPARLVVSLQSVPWKASIGKPKQSSKSRKGEERAEESEPEDEMEEVDIPGTAAFPGDGQMLNGTAPPTAKGKEKAKPIIKLRKHRSKGRALGSSKRTPGPPVGGYPPTQWTEVFSRPDGKWLSVDPIRNFVDKRKIFEPPPHDKRNRMVLIAADDDPRVDNDGIRYAREFTNKTSKIRVGGKGKKDWWEKVMAFLTRPYRLNRDDLEDAELQSRQVIEGMPTSISAFKDHPLYVLERHLLRDETLRSRTEIGRFRGESVFARSAVVSGLKAAENWMRTGRVVAAGEQPMKWVKVHAVTVGRRRALGIAGEMERDAGEAGMQGLYAESQTELYRPPPVVDGKVPKNDFGNIDLYVDTMLPSGAVHIPYKGVAKIARELRLDYAEAVTGFEFKNRRAFPLINGVVVAAEHESALLEAYWESAQDAEEKERIKREERVLKRWTRLVQGLRIRKRLQEQYADHPPEQHGVDNREDVPEAGGFLLDTADSVVQSFTLPKALHPTAGPSKFLGEADTIVFDPITAGIPRADDLDEDEDMEEVVAAPITEPQPRVGVPKTMQQLAEANVHDLHVASSEATTPATTNGSAREGKAPRRATARGKKRRRRGTDSSSEVEQVESGNTPPKPRGGTTTPASGRTLRTRVPKSDEKKRKERELEEAYRRAIAE